MLENDEIENTIFPLMTGERKASNMVVEWMQVMWAVRRELLLKNQMLVDDRVFNGEDFLCVCFCLLEAKSVMAIRQGGYHYIQRASSGVHQMRTPSDKNLLQIKIWYQVLQDQLEQKHASEKTREVCSQIVLAPAMLYDLDWLQKKFPGCLFPFPKVNSRARIVVYGAGKFGYRLVQSLSKTKKCSVVLWVDQNQNLPAMLGHTIRSRDAILSADYDFVVVAIIDAAVSAEVKRSLILDGIPEKKIATMDASAILEDMIPDETVNLQT